MTETEHNRIDEPAPEESPFATPPVEGMPFERGSEEDAAIERVLEKSTTRSGES
jgi:hypothetical protein